MARLGETPTSASSEANVRRNVWGVRCGTGCSPRSMRRSLARWRTVANSRARKLSGVCRVPLRVWKVPALLAADPLTSYSRSADLHRMLRTQPTTRSRTTVYGLWSSLPAVTGEELRRQLFNFASELSLYEGSERAEAGFCPHASRTPALGANFHRRSSALASWAKRRGLVDQARHTPDR